MMFPITGWAVRVPMVSAANNGTTGELSPPLAVLGLHVKANQAKKDAETTVKVTAVLLVDQENKLQLIQYDTKMEFLMNAQPVLPVQQGAPAPPPEPKFSVVSHLPEGL